MKTLFTTVILSIVSALVSVFSVAELCGTNSAVLTGNARHQARGVDTEETRQVVQQWVNQ